MPSLLWEKHLTGDFNYGNIKTRPSSAMETFEIQARAIRSYKLQRNSAMELAGAGGRSKDASGFMLWVNRVSQKGYVGFLIYSNSELT